MNGRHRAVAVIAVAVAVVVVFGSSLGFGFSNWDDQENFVTNVHIRGFSWEDLQWMWTTFHTGPYQPLSWMSIALDDALWGPGAGGIRRTSLLLHLAMALVVQALVERVLRLWAVEEKIAIWCAAAGALLYAIHPLRVESVVWATERRDVLSGLFFVLGLHAYVKAKGTGRKHAVSFGWMLLAVLSKGSTLVLPVWLVAMDALLFSERNWKAVLMRKIPHVALAILVGILATKGQASVDAIRHGYALEPRLAQMGYALAFYAERTLLPVSLSPLVPIDAGATLLSPAYGLRALAFLSTVTVAVALRRRVPALGWGVLLYAASVLPISGLMQAGPQRVADRYSQIACLPLAMAAAWLLSRARLPAGLRVAAASVSCAILGALAHQQTYIWRDSVALWSHAVKLEERNALAHHKLGEALVQVGKLDEAMLHFDRAAAVDGQFSPTYVARGNLKRKLGNLQGAFDDYTVAMGLQSSSPVAASNRGQLWLDKGDAQRALSDFAAALTADPDHVSSLASRARAWHMLGNVRAAMSDADRAIALAPTEASAFVVRAFVRLSTGDATGAEADARRASEVDPGSAQALNALGTVLLSRGNVAEALSVAERAVRVDPSMPELWGTLGLALQQSERRPEAANAYRRALELGGPDWPHRRPTEAFLRGLEPTEAEDHPSPR